MHDLSFVSGLDQKTTGGRPLFSFLFQVNTVVSFLDCEPTGNLSTLLKRRSPLADTVVYHTQIVVISARSKKTQSEHTGKT